MDEIFKQFGGPIIIGVVVAIILGIVAALGTVMKDEMLQLFNQFFSKGTSALDNLETTTAFIKSIRLF